MVMITRRKLMLNATLASGGVLLGFAAPSLSALMQTQLPATRGGITGLVAWVKISADNLVTVIALNSASESAVATNAVDAHRAGAGARWTLIQAAAKHWNVSPQSITSHNGRLIHADTGRSTTYVAVAGVAALPWINLMLRNGAQFKTLA